MLGRQQRWSRLTLHAAAVALIFSISVGAQSGTTRSFPSLPVTSKRGTGWGFNATGLAPELRALPVSWWYNWGNYNPDAEAVATSKVKMAH